MDNKKIDDVVKCIVLLANLNYFSVGDRMGRGGKIHVDSI